MEGFKNPLLHDQIAKLVDVKVKTPFDKARDFFRKKNWELKENGKLFFANSIEIGEVTDIRLCQNEHVHVRVKMFYEFVIPEDTDELKGIRD
jgi:hypothetical protein